MGKGDRRSKKGKIFRASFGNTRPTTEKANEKRREKEQSKKEG